VSEANYRLYRIFDVLYGGCLLKGNPRFHCDPYRRAARVLSEFPEDVAGIYEYEGVKGLRRILPFGRAIISRIVEFLEEGRMEEYEEVMREYGRDAVEFVKVRGIGPATAKALVEMGIRTFDDLLGFLTRGEAKKLFKNPEKVYENVRFYLKYRNHLLAPEARIIVKAFKRLFPSAVAVGGYRRGEPLLEILDFAISEEDAFRLALSGRYDRGHWLWGEDRIPVRIHIYTPEDMGSVLVYATGPEAHVRALEELGGIEGGTEGEVYRRLGLPFIHPFQRWDGEEVRMALRGELPKPVLPEDVPGDTHVHTTYSDGNMRPEEAVRAAIRRGYNLVALTDHSPSSGGGLNEYRLEKKLSDILRLRERYPYIRILFGAEVDILPDGSLDKALENPYVHVIGHPTGRVLKKRPAYRVDLYRIFRRAEELEKALEVNANPRRVDLSGNLLLAGEYRGKVFVGTDAHREWDMDYLYLGCAQISKARIPRDRVGNLLL